MKIYIDALLLLNFGIDFILLFSVSLILRRNVKLKRLIFGSIIGSLSILLLFININSFSLFFYKIFLSIIIILTTFGYKTFKYFLNNILYFYVNSILLGGFLYYLNTSFSYKQIGMIFYHEGLSINYIFLILSSPIIIFIYIKTSLKLKNNYSVFYEVNIYLKSKKIIKLNGYMDTANMLKDPYKKKIVIISNSKKLIKETKNDKFLLVPYDTIDSKGIMKCMIPHKVSIKNMGEFDNVVVGITNNKIGIEGIDCILNKYLLEE